MTVALELGLTFLVDCLNCCLDLLNSRGVSLRNDEADTKLRGAAVDGLGFLDIGVRPTGILASNNLHGVCELSRI